MRENTGGIENSEEESNTRKIIKI